MKKSETNVCFGLLSITNTFSDIKKAKTAIPKSMETRQKPYDIFITDF